MTDLRILTVIAYGIVLFYMLPGALSASFGKDRHRGDPMRLSGAINAFLIAALSLRLLLAPTNDTIWMGLYVLGLVNAIYVIALARAYGRGTRL